MANHTGTKGAAWTDAEVSILRAAPKVNGWQRAVAHQLGRTVDSIDGKIRTMTASDALGAIPGPGLARYEAPAPTRIDHAKHILKVAKTNDGCGFPVVTDPLLSRICALERPIPQQRQFWRGA